MNPTRPLGTAVGALLFATALLFSVTLLAARPASAAAKPSLDYRKVATALQPTSLSSPPGYPRLLFVTERPGKVRVLRRGRWLKRPLLDVSKRSDPNMVERGLLGLAFPPDFRRSGRFYVYYTLKSGDSMIEERRTVPGRPGRLKPHSRRTVLRIPRINDLGNHNGGHLLFRGRLLYISVGDGNDPGDGADRAQSLDNLRGKILRIDPRPDRANGRGYRIPPGNPFVGLPGRDEIFAYGFRNPHSFSFHQPRGKAAMMVISDVGQGRFEELNYLPLAEARGANFGWHDFEGFEPYNCGEACPGGGDPRTVDGLAWPQLVFSHDEGCAIIGGPVITSRALSTIRGRIIYGDFCANRIRTAAPDSPIITDDRPAGFFLPPGAGHHSALNGFGLDGFDRLYAFSHFGGIYRIVQR